MIIKPGFIQAVSVNKLLSDHSLKTNMSSVVLDLFSVH